MKSFGKHLLAEYRGCDRALLDDIHEIEHLMQRAATLAGAHIVATVFHPFSPQGVTGVVVVEESHLSIHTWPEHGYAAVDFYTCGDCRPERAHEYLREALDADYSEVMQVERGIAPPGPSLKIRRHCGGEHDTQQIALPGLVTSDARATRRERATAPKR